MNARPRPGVLEFPGDNPYDEYALPKLTIKKIINLFGWLGVVMILAAYILVTLRLIESDTLLYLLLNLLGSITVLVEAWLKKDYQPVFLNIAWALVAIISLIRIF